MNSLLCDEELSSPTSTPPLRDVICRNDEAPNTGLLYEITKEENEAVISLYLDKEVSFMPEPGYVELLRSKNLLIPRFKSVQWLVKSGIWLSLSSETIFNAVNCLDRFFSLNQCDEWTRWMVELLSLTCLSVASKFNDTNSPSPQEMQVDFGSQDHVLSHIDKSKLVQTLLDGLEFSFQPATIQRMELIVLDTLGWHLDLATPYSFVEILITKNVDQLRSLLEKGLVARVTDMLLTATLDCQLVEYRPSIAAAAAILCSLEELSSFKSGDQPMTHIMNLFSQDQQISLMKYRKILEAGSKSRKGGVLALGEANNPSSPITVLVSERVDVQDCLVDLSPLQHGSNLSSIRKKRRKLFEDQP